MPPRAAPRSVTPRRAFGVLAALAGVYAVIEAFHSQLAPFGWIRHLQTEKRGSSSIEVLGQAAHGQWQARGPGGGGALFVPAINPHDGHGLFMASDMGGVYESLDFGRHWRMLHFRDLHGSERSQVRFTRSPQILYALDLPWRPAHARRVVKSLDGGITWEAPIETPGDNSTLRSLHVDPNDTTRLLVSDQRTLHFSKDGGSHYQEAYSTDVPLGVVIGGVFWDEDQIYVGTSEGILVSHDDGQSFELDPALSLGIPEDEGIVSFAGARRGGVARTFAVTFRRRDASGKAAISAEITGGALDRFAGLYCHTLGASPWLRCDSELRADDKLSLVAMSSRDPDVAYVAGGDRCASPSEPSSGRAPIVLRTDDGGLHWRHVFQSDHNANILTGWSGAGGDVDWYMGEYALGLAVSASDSRRVMMTDLGFVHVSDDGGEQWRQAYVSESDANSAGRDTPKSKFYRSNGVEQTSSWWLTWGSPRTLFASLTDIRSAFSQDGGVTWSRDSNNGLTLNTTYHVVQEPTSGIMYAGTSSVHDIYQSPWLRDSRLDGSDESPTRGAVMFSRNLGASWDQLYDFARPVVWLALDSTRPQLLYASVVNSHVGGIYRINLEHPERPAEILAAPPRTKGHPYNVHILKDGTMVATYSGHQDGDTRVFADRAGVFVLLPGASTWQDRSAPEMHFWTKDIVVDRNNENRWYAGVCSHDSRDFGGLYRTNDRGLSWTRISSQQGVESCALDPKNSHRIYMATVDDGLWMSETADAATPTFRRVPDYPFEHPMRIFFNPYDVAAVWITSFGGGIRMKRE